MMSSATGHRVTLILDTNVFVAAYWSPGSASARLVEACISGRATALYSSDVKREIQHVLRRIKVRLSYVDFLESFWQKAVEITPTLCESIRTEDPDDQKYLEAALGGDADLLVTNDDHLLSVGYVGRTEIVHPKSALNLVLT